MRRISVPTWRRPTVNTLPMQLVAQHARAHEGMLQCNSSRRRMSARSAALDRPREVVHRAATDAQQLAWRVTGSS
jgi:hypothetical protein